ncbi:hypothetical protein [Taibaiella koreensis]|uniref:hypothetical protein n=1 Tax=Taibaiella koreensis TaxID=1268548 RepID=UPI0013C2A829|nr:hypothetical protein [Taibaiella koreensis]
MLRSYICVLLLLFACSGIPATAQNQYQLKGFMGVQGGESFTYKLTLKDSVRNLLSGYGYTYLDEQHDVKAYVTAEVDIYRKTVLLKETRIVYNHNFKSNALICLIEALLVYNDKEKTLSGPLNTMTAGQGADCSRGSITFTIPAEIDHIFHPEATTAAAKDTVVATTRPAASLPKPKPKVIYDTVRKARPAPVATNSKPATPKLPDNITEGKDKTLYWQSDLVVLDIWDGNNEDNDRVRILFNGTEVLKDHVLTKQKKRIELPIGGNELNIISITALNEGGDPPNTANLLLSDGSTQYEVIAHNTIGKSALIKIRKK